MKDHVFELSSRINSTWGGGLVDLVRATGILEIIKDEKLVENAEVMGKRLLAGLRKLADDMPDLVTNVRGLGLLVAFDLPDAETRDKLRAACYDELTIVLTCGSRSIRLRPSLNVTKEVVDEGLDRLRRALVGLGGGKAVKQ